MTERGPEIIDLGKGRQIDPNVVSGVVCPYRSVAFPIPQPGGQIGFVEYVAACRRDCAQFDREKDRPGCRPPVSPDVR